MMILTICWRNQWRSNKQTKTVTAPKKFLNGDIMIDYYLDIFWGVTNLLRFKKVLEYRGMDHFDVLPDGWVETTHSSGLPVYLVFVFLSIFQSLLFLASANSVLYVLPSLFHWSWLRSKSQVGIKIILSKNILVFDTECRNRRFLVCFKRKFGRKLRKGRKKTKA